MKKIVVEGVITREGDPHKVHLSVYSHYFVQDRVVVVIKWQEEDVWQKHELSMPRCGDEETERLFEFVDGLIAKRVAMNVYGSKYQQRSNFMRLEDICAELLPSRSLTCQHPGDSSLPL